MPPINIIWHCKARIPISSSPQNSTVPPPSDNWHCSKHLEHIPNASEKFWDTFVNIILWTIIGFTIIFCVVTILALIAKCVGDCEENQEQENNVMAESEQLLAEKERQKDIINTEYQPLLTKIQQPMDYTKGEYKPLTKKSG
ncbi:hypothetical protein BCON_0694g00010 [Botryotinia convoluta]|uniref:Uncharacterized protein n=1 Tax=Botryotinia convoluta TaxID=54673 RepID=A0A4Z1H7B5_9HELO|nr:hypothetical protein BCON_0694g00010 [Botryotinia convoluta]